MHLSEYNENRPHLPQNMQLNVI